MFETKYSSVETKLKNTRFFVTGATVSALKMTHLLLAGVLSQEINVDNFLSRSVGKKQKKKK